jgi:hypothetical protein
VKEEEDTYSVALMLCTQDGAPRYGVLLHCSLQLYHSPAEHFLTITFCNHLSSHMLFLVPYMNSGLIASASPGCVAGIHKFHSLVDMHCLASARQCELVFL